MTRIFLFRYAELKEIELEDCQRRYDQFLSSGRQRRRAHLTENQMCAGDDKVFLEEICVKGPCKASWRIWPLCRCHSWRYFQADACGGDSGGPLLYLNSYYNWMVAGIVSFGPSACGKAVPGVYTKVANYLDWIEKNTGLELKRWASDQRACFEYTLSVKDMKYIKPKKSEIYLPKMSNKKQTNQCFGHG